MATHIFRLFAENVLHCVITLKEKNKSIQDNIVEKTCALLNSGGGVLRMPISDYEALQRDIYKQLDMFWKTIEQKLTSLVEPSTYNDVFDRLLSGSQEVFLFVNSPQHLCTIHYNLYFERDAGVYEATFQQVVDLAKKSGNRHRKSSNVHTSLKDLPRLPQMFSFEENCGFHESQQIQLKHVFGPEQIFRNHGQRDKVQKHISAFANTNGGVILVGIEDSGIVRGVDIKEINQDEIVERVESMIKDMKFPVIPKRKVHWDLEFIQVSGCTKQHLAVVVIKVAGMKRCGGVYQKTPKSFELQHGKEEAIGFDRWKERIKASELETHTKGLPCLFGIQHNDENGIIILISKRIRIYGSMLGTSNELNHQKFAWQLKSFCE